MFPRKAASLLLELRGHLKPADSCSHQQVHLLFQEEVEQRLHPRDATSLGNDTLCFFGDNFTEWASPFWACTPYPHTWAHRNHPWGALPRAWAGISEGICSLKRWFPYPKKTRASHPNKTTLAWLRDATQP